MTKEEKQLLLKDLCARFPYGVILANGTKARSIDILTKIVSGIGTDKKIEDIKPYLRPLSSMTKEEKKEFQACHCVYELHPDFQPMMCNLANELNIFNWLNIHHFDYRGLIPMGLALETKEGIYSK